MLARPATPNDNSKPIKYSIWPPLNRDQQNLTSRGTAALIGNIRELSCLPRRWERIETKYDDFEREGFWVDPMRDAESNEVSRLSRTGACGRGGRGFSGQIPETLSAWLC